MDLNKDDKVVLDNNWHCTDPDNFQFCKILGTSEFSYCQLKNMDIVDEINMLQSSGHFFDVKKYLTNRGTTINDWYEEDIDVNDYDADEIGEALSPYGGILDGTEDDECLRNQLIAECIFEQNYVFTDW